MNIPWTMMLCVTAGELLLGAWSVAVMDHDLSELPPVADPGPCVPAPKTSAPVGVRAYRRYFANDSLIGRPVPCTRDEKTCFRHNLVFCPERDRCEAIGHGGGGCDLRPNRDEFEKSGRIVGVCKTYKDPCSGYRMAYDGRCHRKEVVRDVICGCGAKPSRHFLGGVECRSSPATPIRIQQPKRNGRCLIPDLRFPNIMRSQFLQGSRTLSKIGFPLKCNSEQAACFAKEKVFVKGSTGCYKILEQGPCPRDHIVALDIHSALKGRVESTCVHVRGGCPRGYKRMLFDRLCHEDREVTIEAPGKIFRNAFGQNFVNIGHSVGYSFHPRIVNGICDIAEGLVGPGMWDRSQFPPCGASNHDLCELYEVEAEPPMPEI